VHRQRDPLGAAGPRLREDCATLVALQGGEEDPGGAKITRAHNLPSRFVLHTVGPIVRGEVADRDRALLASAYEACLDLAAETGGVASLAFCCVSTGVFGFPADAAAAIAVRTVCAWLDRNPGVFERIVFDVFTKEDHARYARLLSR
jgi:O-acetyl-ADP-ribose deacetylase (regulator of RNase III)